MTNNSLSSDKIKQDTLKMNSITHLNRSIDKKEEKKEEKPLKIELRHKRKKTNHNELEKIEIELRANLRNKKTKNIQVEEENVVRFYFPKKNTLSQNEHDVPEFIQPKTSEKKQFKNNPIVTTSTTSLNVKYSKYTKLSEKANCLVIMLVLAIILSLIVLAIVSALYVYGGKSQCGVMIAMKLISIGFFIFGIIVIKCNQRKIKKIIGEKDDPEKIAQSRERMYLYLFCFFLEFVIAFFFVIPTGLIKFQKNIKMSIRSKGFDKSSWIDEFGDNSFNDVINHISLIINVLAGTSYIYAIYLTIIFFFLLTIVNSFRTWKVIIQCNCVAFFEINFIFAYFSWYCVKFNEITRINGGPTWFSLGVFILSIFGMIIALLGIFIIFFEDKEFLLLLILISLALSIAFIVFDIEGSILVSKFQGYKEASCNDLFNYVDEDYLKENLNCKSKYLFKQNSLENFRCPKDRIIIAWEYYKKDEKNSQKYGCINQQCCLETYSFILDIFSYTLLLSFTLTVYCWIMMVGAIYIRVKAEKAYEEGIRDKFIVLVLSFFTAAIVIVIIVFFCLMRAKPNSSDLIYLKAKEVEKEKALIPLAELNVADKYALNSLNSEYLKERKKSILKENNFSLFIYGPEKYDVKETYISFYSEDGNISISQNSKFTIENQNYNNKNKIKSSSLSIKASEDILNSFLDFLNFEPFFPMKPLYINMRIEMVFEKTTQLRRINGLNESKESIKEIFVNLSNYEPNSRIEVYSNTIDFSIVDKENPLYFTGNIINNKENSSISLYSDIYSVEPVFEVYINSTGVFEIELYSLLSNMPFEYNVTIKRFSGTLNEVYNTSIKIGGFGFDNQIEPLTNITLPSDSNNNNQNLRISGIIKDSKNNKILEKTKAYLFKGYKKLKINEVIENVISQYDQLSTANENAEYTFTQLNDGQYTVIFSKDNYYAEIILFSISEERNNFQLSPISLSNINNNGEISVMLSWEEGPIDLDLHCKFPYDQTYFCDVFFGNRECANVIYNYDNQKGGKNGVERIEIKNFGQYYYLFYVEKYNDISNGLAMGEDAIKGVSFSNEEQKGKEDIENIEDRKINESNAVITLYTPGYSISTLKVKVPKNINTTSSSSDKKKEEKEKAKRKEKESNIKYWVAFCINGQEGISSLKLINSFPSDEPDYNYCEQFYTYTNDN